MNANRMSLLRQIMELQFTAIELNLFLDTHPENQEALRDIKNVNERLRALVDEYERLYGPLTPFSTRTGQEKWLWIEEPWPWEMVY
ncbi:MAG: spore coat protein CotJB [Peptococcaceae bacterium]|nr:spore coat protein CotJB [Peptococcaceae bacterium]